MLQNKEIRALDESVARLVNRLVEFSLGRGELKDLISEREEILNRLRAVPGIFLVTPNGESAWDRLVNSRTDQETVESLAGDLAEVLKDGGEHREVLQFIDDTFTVVYDNKPEPVQNPLAYAVLKVLYAMRGQAVKMKDLVQYLDDSDLIRGRSREEFPVVDDTPAGRRRVSRAVKSLPPRLLQLITGNRNGRRFKQF